MKLPELNCRWLLLSPWESQLPWSSEDVPPDTWDSSLNYSPTCSLNCSHCLAASQGTLTGSGTHWLVSPRYNLSTSFRVESLDFGVTKYFYNPIKCKQWRVKTLISGLRTTNILCVICLQTISESVKSWCLFMFPNIWQVQDGRTTAGKGCLQVQRDQ